MEIIEEKWKRAWSLREDDCRKMTEIATKVWGKTIYRLYEDEEGECWYTVAYIDESTGEIIDEETYIFGRKLKKKSRRRR